MRLPDRCAAVARAVLGLPLLAGVIALAACEPRKVPEPKVGESSPLQGITPSTDLKGASDHMGAPAVGALSASQAGAAPSTRTPQTTAGDGVAPASAPASR